MARALASALPVPAAGRLDAEGRPLDLADFPGCEAVHIPQDEIEEHEGRLEYWDSRTETAIVVCEPTSPFHERPSQRLARLAERIAASRGSIIETFGTSDLVRVFSDGRARVLMQADQVLYLDPPSVAELAPKIDVDKGPVPDVVLEVDYSTDVRRGKLPRYEAWRFPEVWVDVPDERSPSRPKSRRSGLTIHLLANDRFHEARESRAFPGWTATEIHRALNEHTPSAETYAVLRRVGRALGALEGTGPDDDPWLRHERDEGRAEGRAAALVEVVEALLEARGMAVTSELAARLAGLGDRQPAELMRAARQCVSAEDLLNRLRG